jgi:hypothetical protein
MLTWGVTYETFEKMVEIVALHSQQKKKTGRLLGR